MSVSEKFIYLFCLFYLFSVSNGNTRRDTFFFLWLFMTFLLCHNEMLMLNVEKYRPTSTMLIWQIVSVGGHHRPMYLLYLISCLLGITVYTKTITNRTAQNKLLLPICLYCYFQRSSKSNIENKKVILNKMNSNQSLRILMSLNIKHFV